MKTSRDQYILPLSLPLAAIVFVVGFTGLSTEGFYAAETASWQVQSVGQDWINTFFVVPALLVSSLLASRKNRAGFMVWGGVNLYLVYTFEIYCFDVHFNSLFLMYCAALGLSFYSALYFFYRIITHPLYKFPAGHDKVIQFTALQFMTLAAVFFLLWISQVINNLTSTDIAASLKETGLFTNPVQVIDLSIFLPGVFFTGWALMRNHWQGLAAAPALLTFFLIMNVTIAVLNIMEHEKGLHVNTQVAGVMLLLAGVSFVLLSLLLQRLKAAE